MRVVHEQQQQQQLPSLPSLPELSQLTAGCSRGEILHLLETNSSQRQALEDLLNSMAGPEPADAS